VNVTEKKKGLDVSIEAALTKVIGTIPDCVAGGIVDLGSGMILALRTVDSHPREVIDLLAAATTDLFEGPNVKTIETLFKRARGLPDTDLHYFQEIIVNSDNLIHVFMRGKRFPDYVMTFVCRRSTNLGMALTKSRLGVPTLEAALAG
jgi:hypothetical protein